MDFLRTLKKRKPKKQAKAAGDRQKSRGIRIRKRGVALNLACSLALCLGLAVVTQAQAEGSYIYQTPSGALVISNKEPPAGSKIIRQHSWPEASEKEVAQAQETGKPQPNLRPEGSPQLPKKK